MTHSRGIIPGIASLGSHRARLRKQTELVKGSDHDRRCSGQEIEFPLTGGSRNGPGDSDRTRLPESGDASCSLAWSRRSGVRNATMSIRRGCDFDDGFSSSQGAGGRHDQSKTLSRLLQTET